MVMGVTVLYKSCQAPSEVSLLEQQIVEAYGGISQPE
jgi:hypothetical protein